MESNAQEYKPRDAANEGGWLTLIEPDGVASKRRLHLMGADSDAYRDKLHELQRKGGREFERTRKLKMPAPEQLEADSLELLVVVAKGWEGFTQSFSGQAVRALFVERPDYKEQADFYINDRSNFFKRAATS